MGATWTPEKDWHDSEESARLTLDERGRIKWETEPETMTLDESNLSVWVCPVCPVEGCVYVGELTTEERHAFEELTDHLRDEHSIAATVRVPDEELANLAPLIAERIDNDEPLDEFEEVFPWTVSTTLEEAEVMAALRAWQGHGESREDEHAGGYRYLVPCPRGWWAVIEVSENMGIDSVSWFQDRDLARREYLAI
jgi:hypothetical protein